MNYCILILVVQFYDFIDNRLGVNMSHYFVRIAYLRQISRLIRFFLDILRYVQHFCVLVRFQCHYGENSNFYSLL